MKGGTVDGADEIVVDVMILKFSLERKASVKLQENRRAKSLVTKNQEVIKNKVIIIDYILSIKIMNY